MLSNLDSDSATGPDGISPHVLKPTLLLLLTPSLFYSPSHLLQVICHLLGNQQTLPLCIKRCKNRSLQLQTNLPSPNHQQGYGSHHHFQHYILPLLQRPDFQSSNTIQPGHSSLDLQLLLYQQWMEVLNARHEIRAIFQDISCAFDTVWHPALLTKLSSYGIQG